MPLLRRISNLFSRLRNLFFLSRIDREIREELAAHIAMRSEDNVAAGMAPEEAQRDARVRFGNPTAMRERVTEADAALFLETAWSDLRFAARQLRSAPGFAIASIVILSLGIGASTAIFSAIKPILLDPLPYPHAERLTMLWETRLDGFPINPTFATFHGMSERNHSFAALAVMRPWQPVMAEAVSEADRTERFEGQRVSAAFFDVLGVMPRLGRNFEAADDRLNGPRVVILSDRLWRRRFAANPAIIGAQVRLDTVPYTVAGVMPAKLDDVLEPVAELWTPLQYDPSMPVDGREWGHHLRMIGRLHEGVTREQATGELNAILQVLAPLYAKGYDSTGGAPRGMLVNALQGDLTAAVRPALLVLLGAVGLMLLIVCVNVTNLVLARGAQRRAEFAMRAALGATQGRLIRQLLTESLLLALLGGVLGIGVATAGVRALVALSPPDLPRVSAIAVHGPIFLFALLLSALLGAVVGLVPAWQATRADLQTGLRQSSRNTAGGRRWTRGTLVVAEVSLAVVLLVTAGLLLRSMQRLFATNPGFDSAHVVTMQVQATGRGYRDEAALHNYFKQAVDAVRPAPGVVSAGFTSQLPLSGERDVYGIQFEKTGSPTGESAFRYAVTPGYVEAMHIPLRRGRLLNEHDIEGAPVAVLINEALATRVFQGQNPIGQRVRVGPDVGHADRPWATIVGVVGNVKQESLAVAEGDAFYITDAQWAFPDPALSLVVRTRGPAAAMASTIRDAIWSVDKEQPVVRIATMDALLAASESQRHFVLMLLEVFALIGLVLAATGIYGVLAGSVTERTREIGVRAALGATRGNLQRLVLRQGMALAVAGVVLGLSAAVGASRAIAALLFGISRFDPLTYGSVAGCCCDGLFSACAPRRVGQSCGCVAR